jgi:hypothetical protein
VPLRFIAESLDKDVEWIADTRTVIINDKSEKPKEEIKPIVSNLPDSLEIERYKNVKNFSNVLYIKIYLDNFTYGDDYSFKTTCINRPDLNQKQSLMADGTIKIIDKNIWESFDGAKGKDEKLYTLFGLLYKDSPSIRFNPYLLAKDNVKDGEVLEFEVQARYNPTGEVKTYYTQWVW